MNLDRERIYLQCPKCNFIARPFLRQVRHQDVLICAGCKANIWLTDHLGQYRVAERRVRKAIEELREQLGSINMTIRF